ESSGTYDWAADGHAPLTLEFRARANWPVRHVHVSDLARVASALGVEQGPGAADSSWDAIERSNEAVDASRELVKALRGARPATMDRGAPLPGATATRLTSGARTRAS
ncbi:MAG TPA: hypothetical protein VGC90_10755, partial [Candidatus Limnocylindrales bacterium]